MKMNWQDKPIIKGRDEITEVTSEMLAKIKNDDAKAELDRKVALNRREEFLRKKEAKEKGIPYVPLEEIVQTEEIKVKKEKKIEVPVIWRALSEFKLKIIDKINLEKFNQKEKTSENGKEERIFDEESLEQLYSQALIILNDKEIDEEYVKKIIEDFITLYDYDAITSDMQDIIEKEERIKGDSPEKIRAKKMATVLEAILVEGIAKYQWLGGRIKIHAPSKFDELIRGVDGIVEFDKDEEGNDFLALGIDVSFRSFEGDLFEEKIDKLLGGIDRGHLTQIKYFKDTKDEAKEDFKVPKVVVSVDYKTMEELAMIWSKRKDPLFKEKFKNNKIAFDVIGQIADQCKLFSAYATKSGFPEIAEKYDDVLKLLMQISEEVPETKKVVSNIGNNKFVERIDKIIQMKIAKSVVA